MRCARLASSVVRPPAYPLVRPSAPHHSPECTVSTAPNSAIVLDPGESQGQSPHPLDLH